MSSNNIFQIFFFTYTKIFKDSSAKYYQNNKERLQKKAPERYQSLSKEKEENMWQYGCERYKNLPEDEKQKLVQYRKKYSKMSKTSIIIIIRNYNLKTCNDLESSFDKECTKAKYQMFLTNIFLKKTNLNKKREKV